MEQRSPWMNFIAERTDVLVAAMIVGIVMMMIIPMPTWLLDILLTFNITFALIIIMVSVFNLDPLDFSVFPSLLLIMTLFRLALNISSTRLILLHAYAGEVINTFGSFVVGGNTVVGFIIFLILVVIQFIVITRGAERVSEVAARFTLDAMPGKQMAIDADLNAGLINEDEARERRQKIQREADFYGAMDGASKFVKGDAIAGIIIVIINVVGGLIIGMAQRGMPAGEAVQVYTLLTVGDGLVTQIPALLMSTATGIVVTRSASQFNLGKELTLQVFSYPKALGLAAIILFILGTIGLPRTPMYALGAFFGALFILTRNAGKAEEEQELTEDVAEAEQIKRPENVMELLQVEKMEMELGYGLIPLVDVEQGGDLLDRIVMIRRQCAVELGFIVPPIRIRDNMQLKPNSYVVKIKGAEIASGELLLDHYLAIGPDIENDMDLIGVDTVEPAFGLPARWINTAQKDQAEMNGYTVVDPPSVLATHLTTVIKNHAFELLGRQEVQNMVDYIKEQNPAVVSDLIPDLINLSELQKVLSNLLREQVSIRDLTTILETLADYGRLTKDVDVLTEYVRQALRRQITRQYAGEDKKLQVLTLDPAVEDILRSSIQQSEFGSYLAVDPEVAQSLIDKVSRYHEDLIRRGTTPIILCAPILRIYFKRLLDRFMTDLVVLSYNEIDSNVQVEVVGMVSS
ncbi:MAG: flagellar biosynthesis protein FlhA [Syntrophomonadaceae bacterium]|jgi:flagellar biosynthesis protein FlhA|nr:flagellar biosynthesis protein FlhA [Bacillota bacterium]NLM89344.1 flagellar biosynthesis protein FlhA [Syntrophomonadaceae bacterium]HAA09086.1 flagellar biosynthesis protein FlhA [Syntrophomonas sp.]HQA49064.1 flagellar biosynthesis protein FlhA [Syntrophomonadaceae bacterium]HQD89436.1 flagellar biosynthesis protein FlhA [Syntrophomonadaceae bacterium]